MDESFAMDGLNLEKRIPSIIAITLCVHAAHETVLSDQYLIGLGTILAGPIGIHSDAAGVTPTSQRYLSDQLR